MLDLEFPGLGDPRLGTLALGSNIDIVLRVDDDQCIALWHRERCMVKGLSFEGPGTFTVYGAVLQGFQESLPILTGADATQVTHAFASKSSALGWGALKLP